MDAYTYGTAIKYINTISKWASLWLMKFNISKCCCLQFTEAKIYRVDRTYHLYDTPLSSSCNYITHSLIAVNWMSILDCTIRYSKCPKLHDEFTIKNYAFFNSSLC